MEESTAYSFAWIKPNHYGCIFLIGWMFILLYSPIGMNDVFPGMEFISTAYVCSMVSLCATLVAVSLRPKRLVDWANAKAVRLATPSVMAVGTALYVLFHFNGVELVGVVGGVTTGVSSALLSVRWAREFSCLRIEELLVNLPALAVTSIVLCLTLLYFPREAIFAALVLMPFMSEILLERAGSRNMPSLVRKDPIVKKGRTGYVFIVLVVGMIGLATGFVDSMIGKGYFTLALYAAVIVLLFASTLVFILKSERRYFVSAYALPLILLCAILVPFASLFAQSPVQMFVSVGEICFEVLLFTLMVVYAYFFKISPVSAYCVGRISMAGLSMIGWLAGDYLSARNLVTESSSAGLVLTLLGAESLAIIILAAFIISKSLEIKRSDDAPSESEDGPAPTQPTIEHLYRERCEALRETYGLSEREVDVLVLLARGYSSAAIQESLHIAAGTVNSHTRNIYQKLGIHSKNEIFTLLEE